MGVQTDFFRAITLATCIFTSACSNNEDIAKNSAESQICRVHTFGSQDASECACKMRSIREAFGDESVEELYAVLKTQSVKDAEFYLIKLAVNNPMAAAQIQIQTDTNCYK